MLAQHNCEIQNKKVSYGKQQPGQSLSATCKVFVDTYNHRDRYKRKKNKVMRSVILFMIFVLLLLHKLSFLDQGMNDIRSKLYTLFLLSPVIFHLVIRFFTHRFS
ncbi:MAG: DUF3675 domain-containing protein [Chitinophagaceae bacterium]|nr:MAG: DUF3675 domain-containing protein [Chitinophagaceae bacterium]